MKKALQEKRETSPVAVQYALSAKLSLCQGGSIDFTMYMIGIVAEGYS